MTPPRGGKKVKLCPCGHANHCWDCKPPRKPKSVGVKAYAILSKDGELEANSRWEKQDAEHHSHRNGDTVIPVMIVPCREGKKKGAIRRLASEEDSRNA